MWSLHTNHPLTVGDIKRPGDFLKVPGRKMATFTRERDHTVLPDFVHAQNPVNLSFAQTIDAAVVRRLPGDVTMRIATYIPREPPPRPQPRLQGATFAVFSAYVLEADFWDPQGIHVYSLFGDPLRIPIPHQPWRYDEVYDHVFRPQAVLRERGWIE